MAILEAYLTAGIMQNTTKETVLTSNFLTFSGIFWLTTKTSCCIVYIYKLKKKGC